MALALALVAGPPSVTKAQEAAPREPSLEASGGGVSFTRVVVADTYTCGLTTEGKAYCWGDNSSGQLGDGTTEPRPWPTAVAGELRFRSLVVSSTIPDHAYTCGITTEAAAYCWGDNEFGQLGDGTSQRRTVPTAVSSELRFQSLLAGLSWVCGLADGNRVHCWGILEWVFGRKERTVFPSPRPVKAEYAFANLVRHTAHPCGVSGEGPMAFASPGKVYCWIVRDDGELAFQGMSPEDVTLRSLVGGETGPLRHCGLATDGEIICWWRQQRSENQARIVFAQNFAPWSEVEFETERLAPGIRFVSVVSGGDRLCGVSVEGRLHCVSDKSEGTPEGLSDITQTPALAPLSPDLSLERLWAGPVTCVWTPSPQSSPGPLGSLREGCLGDPSSLICGLAADGQAYCWGRSSRSVPGDGTREARETPVPVSGGLAFTTLSVGSRHVCGVAVNGEAYCWGDNSSGQLGDGTREERLVPVRASGPVAGPRLEAEAGIGEPETQTQTPRPETPRAIPEPEKAGTIVGRLVDEDGGPRVGVPVQLFWADVRRDVEVPLLLPADRDDWSRDDTAFLLYHYNITDHLKGVKAETDDQGRFTLEPPGYFLHPGEGWEFGGYVVVVREPGSELVWDAGHRRRVPTIDYRRLEGEESGRSRRIPLAGPSSTVNLGVLPPDRWSGVMRVPVESVLTKVRPVWGGDVQEDPEEGPPEEEAPGKAGEEPPPAEEEVTAEKQAEESPDASYVLGRLVGEDGEPRGGVEVELWWGDANRDRETEFFGLPVRGRTDAQGRFRLQAPRFFLQPQGWAFGGYVLVLREGDRYRRLQGPQEGDRFRIWIQDSPATVDLGTLPPGRWSTLRRLPPP